MCKTLFFCSVLLLTTIFSQAQERESGEIMGDTVPPVPTTEGIVVDGSVKRGKTNPLAPSKAAFYSAILPGLGQIYNKRYWKLPIVYGAIGTGIYFYNFNNNEYNRFRDAFKRRRAGFTDDEFYDINGDGVVPGSPDISDQSLQNAQERAQSDRDLVLLITIALYALNIVDANVDAHLQQYNVDDDLSLDVKPYLEFHPVLTVPSYGLALTINL